VRASLPVPTHAALNRIGKMLTSANVALASLMLAFPPTATCASGKVRRRLRVNSPDASSGWEDWGDMPCFVDLSRFGLHVGEPDIVFRGGHATSSGDPQVLVFEDHGTPSKARRRTLIFKSADGRCNGQAAITCKQTESSLSLLTTIRTGAMNLCSMDACTADMSASLADLGAGYVRSMVGAMAWLPPVSSGASSRQILSIGLGAGTLALALQEVLPGSRQTVVELSGTVADAAPCFGSGEFDVVVGDGRTYLEKANDGELDAVLVDAFNAEDRVPPCFVTSEFFRTARKKLRSGGILVMNSHSGKTLHDDVHDLLPAAQSVFGQSVMLGQAPGLGNVIVVARATDGHEDEGVSTLLQEPGKREGVPEEISAWFHDAEFVPAEPGSAAGAGAGRPILRDADVMCASSQ